MLARTKLIWVALAVCWPFSLAAMEDSLFVTSTGNVGVGTSTPGARLEVKTNAAGKAVARLQNSSSAGFPGIEYLDSTGTVDLFFGLDNANANTRLNSINNYPIVLLTNSTEKMRVTSGGSVGIGTAAPATKLHVAGSAGTTKALVEETSATTAAREILELRNNGGTIVIIKDTSQAPRWSFGTSGTSFVNDNQANPGVEMSLTSTGNLILAGTVTQNSDRNTKTQIEAVDPEVILARLASLPIATWRKQGESATHLGPMAQDFAATFGLGDDDRRIAPLDVAGVGLAALQALSREWSHKDAEIEALQRDNASLAVRVEALEALVASVVKR